MLVEDQKIGPVDAGANINDVKTIDTNCTRHSDATILVPKVTVNRSAYRLCAFRQQYLKVNIYCFVNHVSFVYSLLLSRKAYDIVLTTNSKSKTD